MAKAHLREAVESQLQRIGSDVPSFLRAGVAQGKSPHTLAEDLDRLVGIDVHWRTIYRWLEDLPIEQEAS